MRRAKRFGEPRAVFLRAPVTLNILRRSLRLHQWAKNALVFAPLVLGGKAGDLSAWLNALLGFFALSFVASATYIVNDLWDLPSDRRHWSKRMRPLASGDLSIRAGIVLAIAGLAAGFGLVTSAGPAALAMLGLYTAGALSYSFAWKRVAILDVFVLASLFTLRLGFGIVLTEVRLSPWLLVFSMFVFTSLSIAKRHTEVLRLAERGLGDTEGRGYIAGDAPLTLGMGLASMFAGVLIMILYLIEDALPQGVYAHPSYLWAIPFILSLFLGRIWLLSQRNQLRDDPVAFALKDRVSLLLGLLMSIVFAAALIKVG
jgi:4-hydroxybenzoate polyprenyltransferase